MVVLAGEKAWLRWESKASLGLEFTGTLNTHQEGSLLLGSVDALDSRGEQVLENLF